MMDRIKIKVCGMRREGNVREVASLDIDYMGFIFYERSPRFCSCLSRDVLSMLPPGVKGVAVTVDMDESEILGLAGQYGFGIFQLHGSEPPELCRRLRERGLKVIKAMPVGQDAGALGSLGRYAGAVDLFLLDTACAGKGGSGKKFDWGMLERYDFGEDFILSGGIGGEDAEAISAIRHPRFAGIDLNSRFECAPGEKNVSLIAEFIDRVRKK